MPKSLAKRKFLLPVVASISTVAAGGIAYWWFTQHPDLVREMLIGGEVIPQNALLTLSVSTDAAKWQQLRSYGNSETKAIFNSQLASLSKRYLTDNGYDYQRDIQPWIGKQVLVAYLRSNNPKELQAIAVLPIADKLKAQQLLSGKRSATERNYKGIKISQQGSFSTMVLEDELVATTSSQTAEIVVDTFLEKSGIGRNSNFMSTLAKVKNEKSFANLYLNLSVLTDFLAKNAPQNFSGDRIIKAQIDTALVANAILEPETIRFQGISWLKYNSSRPIALENRVTAIPNLLPADTLMMVSGSSLESAWREFVLGADSNPIAPFKPKDVQKGVEASTGLSLDRDLLPWMKQEFSVSLIPKTGTDNSSVGLFLIAKASDRAAANQAFAKLDAFVAQKYQLKISEAKSANSSLVNWELPTGGFAATRGFANQDLAFINLGDTVTSQLILQPQIKLADNPLFKLATDSNLTAIESQFYLDLERTVNSGNLSIPRLFPQQDKFTKSMRAIGLTTSILDAQTSRFELLVIPKKF
jgi:hypothetical protein